MKKLLTFLMMSILTIGVGWAETVTLTQSYLGLTGSYTTNTEKTLDGITYVYTDLMKSNDNIQAKATSGEIHNTTAFPGDITSVAITHSGTARATNILGSSDGTNWTQVATGSGTITGDFSGKGYKYFKITRGSNAAYWTKIEIVYEEGGEPEPDPETPTATVNFSPTNGEVAYGTEIILSLNGEANGIKYTLDGNDPTSTSNTYVGPISITEETTIKAAAYNYSNSKYALGEVAEASYTLEPVDATIYSRVTSLSAADVGKQFLLVCESKNAGMGAVESYGADITLKSIANGQASITYEQVVPVTLSGSDGAWTFATPDSKYLSWTDGNTLNATETGNIEWKVTFTGNNVYIKNKADESRVIRYNASNPRFACYTSAQTDIQLYRLVEAGTIIVAAPTISGTDNFEGSTQVTITAEEGAEIYYTLDESTPTTASNQYSAPFTITETTTVKAIAVVDGTSSDVATAKFNAKTTISSISEFNALDLNTNFKYTADNLVAIAKNGNQLYVQDGEKGMLIYGSLGQTYQYGDVIPGGFTGTRSTHEGAPEMTNPDGFTASTQNVDVTPVPLTPSQVNLENFGRYAIIKNAAFNTTAKTITASGETIAYYTTFNNNIPTDGAAYDVIGVCGYYNNNPQFLPISFTEAVTTGPDYYLVGSFNTYVVNGETKWVTDDPNYKFVPLSTGGYTLNKKTMPDGVLFKIIKVEGETVSWLGGSAGDYFGITKDVCSDIPLVDGANFKMDDGGICTFTISSEQKLSVDKEAQFFMKGSFSDDDWATKAELEATNNGWTITIPLEIDDEFKFVDEWGTWYGGGNTIAETNLGAQITLNNGGNFVMAVDGDFVINVATDKSNFVITRKAETSEVMFNFNDDYATLFPDLDLTTLPYEILEPITATVDGISVTISPKTSGSTANRIYNNNPKLRVYTGTITVTAPEGYNLTSIDFTSNDKFSLTPSEGNISGTSETHTWTGETATLVLTVGGNTQIGTMNVTIAKINVNTPATPVIEGESPFVGSTQVTITCDTEGASIYYTTNGNDPTTESTLYEAPFTINEAVTVKAIAYSAGGVASQIATKVFEKTPSIENLTAFYNYEGTDEFAFTGNLVVIAQKDNYLYAQDDAKGVLIYGTIDQTYQKCDKIPAGFHAKKGAYAGAPQMTNATGMQQATEQATIQPVELTIAQASQDNQENLYRYAVIKEVKYEDGKIFSGTDELTIYDQRFTTEITPVDGKTYNVTGIVGWHYGPQFMPLEYELVQLPVSLEGVTFTADRQWATWCGAEPLVLPENVTAYVVKGVQGDAVTVESVDYIPADLGVLLYSTTPAANLTAEVYTDEIEDEPESELKGTLEDMTVSEEVYVLYNNKFILAQNGTTVGAHRCYLPASVLEETGTQSGAPVLRIALPGTVTGIEGLRYDSNGKPVGYYDLTGRYVGTSLNGKRGIFITSDGKKVVK